ncbi:MAG TPA: Ppx/GppA phosphatase family protein [Solirubrobacteraceae bacterium]|nr:Ppx/GppA phosphatase family protein [Solirubrobacteraceae bacterium]
MRVAVVDLGTNSTRLLVADVGPGGSIAELDRRTTVTRLGQGVDATGALAPEAVDRVLAVLRDYRRAIDEHGAERTVAVLTSAVRDASNGGAFTERVRREFGLDARTIGGDEEARLTFLGATAERPVGAPAPVVVIDIGGGSTEYVVGDASGPHFHASTQSGTVRQTERHLHSDPPTAEELANLRREVRSIIEHAVPAQTRSRTRAAIAVAGTPTSLAAIDQKLEPYDPDRVHGYVLTRERAEMHLDALARMTNDERRAVPGLHPARAPTIVAGALHLVEALDAFCLDFTEVSEHDILRGAALEAVHRRS